MKLTINKRTMAHWMPLREERDRLLGVTDKYMAPDRLQDSQVEDLKAYRQRLRELPQLYQAATTVEWPAPPPFIHELNTLSLERWSGQILGISDD